VPESHEKFENFKDYLSSLSAFPVFHRNRIASSGAITCPQLDSGELNQISQETLAHMEHKGFQYSVVQTSNPTGWKWIVRLKDGRTRTGTAPNRAAAIRLSEIRIEKAVKKKRSREFAE
jgi:hypothetical protein